MGKNLVMRGTVYSERVVEKLKSVSHRESDKGLPPSAASSPVDVCQLSEGSDIRLILY
jgi:hypothetical protein